MKAPIVIATLVLALASPVLAAQKGKAPTRTEADQIKRDFAGAEGGCSSKDSDRIIEGCSKIIELILDKKIFADGHTAAVFSGGTYSDLSAYILIGANQGDVLLRLYQRRGDAFLLKQEFDRALADYDKSLGLNEINTDTYVNNRAACEVHLNRGQIYAGQRNYDRAIAEYDASMRAKSWECTPSQGETLRDQALVQRSGGTAPVSSSPQASDQTPKTPPEEIQKSIDAATQELNKLLATITQAAAPAPSPSPFSPPTVEAPKPAPVAAAPDTPVAPPPATQQAAVEPTKPVAAEVPSAPIAQPAALRSDKRIALVIGNGAYKSVNPLRNPDADAHAIAEEFRKLGFTEVVEKHDLSLANLSPS
jgi:tetratricopeptide (TPR) repeat protein